MQKLEFDPIGHTYRVNGRDVPYVTQLIENWRAPDFSRVPACVLENARREGVEMHEHRHSLLTGKNGNFHELTEMLDSLELGPLLCCEESLYSQHYDFAGTPDAIFERGIVDHKRTICNHKLHALQLAGYSILAKENGLIGDNRKWFVLSDRPVNVYHPQAEGLFLGLVQKYRIEQSLENYLNSI